MVRVAEALREPAWDGEVHCIRWRDGKYDTPGFPEETLDMSDPRVFGFRESGSTTIGLTSLSWMLPVILSADGTNVEEVRYDLAIEPRDRAQAYGVEDPRISRIAEGEYYMTACAVSGDRLGTSLYKSSDALEWEHLGLVLDHQNKDMLLFEGKLPDGRFVALTRPQGDVFLAPTLDTGIRAGPAIHLAASPDALHWRPLAAPLLRPKMGGAIKLGGGTPPILTERGWLMLYHAVHAGAEVGRYRTYWALLDADDPTQVLHESAEPILTANPALTAGMEDQMYLTDVIFTTGIVSQGDGYLVASGECDLACRMTSFEGDGWMS